MADKSLLTLPTRTYRVMHSAGWITPDGEFIAIPAGETHDAVTHLFPGIPDDEQYPSSYAVANLGYVRVTNGFDYTYDGIDKIGDSRTTVMAQFTAQSAIFSKKNRMDPFDFDEEQKDPAFWSVKIRVPDRKDSRVTRIRETMFAIDFVSRYGQQGLDTWMLNSMGMNESYVRYFIRKMLIEVMKYKKM